MPLPVREKSATALKIQNVGLKIVESEMNPIGRKDACKVP